MGFVAETIRRFFHPICIDEMLQEFVPSIIGSNLDVRGISPRPHIPAPSAYMIDLLANPRESVLSRHIPPP